MFFWLISGGQMGTNVFVHKNIKFRFDSVDSGERQLLVQSVFLSPLFCICKYDTHKSMRVRKMKRKKSIWKSICHSTQSFVFFIPVEHNNPR